MYYAQNDLRLIYGQIIEESWRGELDPKVATVPGPGSLRLLVSS